MMCSVTVIQHVHTGYSMYIHVHVVVCWEEDDYLFDFLISPTLCRPKHNHENQKNPK